LTWPYWPAWPLIEPILTIRPYLRSFMPAHTAFAMLKQPPRLTSITSSQAARSIRFIVPSRVIPALLTRISTGPSSLSTCATPARQASRSATSHLYALMPVRSLNARARSSLPA
jgi:hypothetical protein